MRYTSYIHVLTAITLHCAACSDKSKASQPDAASADQAAVADIDAAVTTDTITTDTADASWQPQCPGGIGCACVDATDCDAPLCLETADGKRCSAHCGDGSCAPGWSCGGQTAGADPTYYCVPTAGLICRPCQADNECQSAGNAAARCVDYGDVGGFCGLACKSDANCPADRVCRLVSSLQGGAATEQCVAPGATDDTLGACACSSYASAQKLITSCWQSSGVGADAKRCKGSRACGAGGLGACALLTGDAAVCQQAQCLDAQTLQPVADGKACDDGRACTSGDVCAAGVCQAGATNICACEPGFVVCEVASGATNQCLGPLVCVATPDGAAPYACVANAAKTTVCDASLDSACSKNACLPLSGACTLTAAERTTELCDLPAGACRLEVKAPDLPSNAATACDDGLACSAGEVCSDGACKAVDLSACKCKSNADCLDDGDLCNGTPYCDTSGAVWACVINPSTIVSCDTSSDSGCQATSCTTTTGVCTKATVAAGMACSDGVACTVGDVCDAAGVCKPGTWTCCKSDVDCAGEEDGNLCNGTLFCNQAAGSCDLNPSTAVTCPTANDSACSAAQCQVASGKCAQTAVNAGKACDDGAVCTEGEVCSEGSCAGGTDTCPCAQDADCAAKDDGNLCNGTLYCNQALGQCKPNPKTVVTCQSVDDTACSKAQCDAKKGKCAVVDLAVGVACDADGTACTANDACDGKGGCAAGITICACISDADCANKDDGDLCNGTLYCDKSGPQAQCKVNPATVKSCPSVDDTACLKNQCAPKTGGCGFVNLAAGAPCEDGEACTIGDGCDGKGGCAAGPGNGCGCKVDVDCAGFDDGDVCNGAFACKGGGCVFDAKVLVCDDQNACTKDSCDKANGCVAVALAGCATCTTDEDCGDGNLCTFDFCLVGICKWPAAWGGCQDGDACSEGDVCAAGICKAGGTKVCDDNNVCTDDSCDAKSGCIAVNNAAPCGDGTICTVDDQCAQGKCTGDASGTDGLLCQGDTWACLIGGCVDRDWSQWLLPEAGSFTFQDGGATFLDNNTKLRWQAVLPAQSYNWSDAKAYCKGVTIAGGQGWRLPARIELETLVDRSVYNPATFTALKASTPNEMFWSATPCAPSSGAAWVVVFLNGHAHYVGVSDTRRVRCVR